MALAAQTRFAAWRWIPFAWLAPLAFVASFLIARRSLRAVYAAVFGAAYIFPVILQATRHQFNLADQVIWLAAVLGLAAARSDWRRWTLPAGWKLPLVYWALAVAAVWPIVVAREADFNWFAMGGHVHIPNNGLGNPPPGFAELTLNVSLTYLAGILLFDSFFAAFEPDGDRAFRRTVVFPLIAGFMVSAAVSQYQAFVNIAWLSAHAWPAMGRAAGGLVDGDAWGALAGFWTPAAWALVPVLNVAGLAACSVVAAVAWASVWASGARMALVGGVLGTAGVLVSAARTQRLRAPVLIAFAVVFLATGLAVFRHGYGSIDDPLRRTLASLPSFNRESLVNFVKVDLYDRHAPYGSASMAMLRRFPASGVGIGTYNLLFPDYSVSLVGVRFPGDNAQSWFRHQLAELGIVGSLGWIWWVGSFGWLLAVSRADPGNRFRGAALKSALVAIVVVSLVSMPTQVIPISLTVWVFAFWYLCVARAVPRSALWDRWTERPLPWIVLWSVAAFFALDSYVLARTELRPPHRAVLYDWSYQRGFHRPDKPENGAPFRWMAEDEAVAVFPATGRYLKLTFWVHHSDVARNPVRVTISGMNRELGAVDLHDSLPVTWYIRVPTLPIVPDGHPRMMIEAHVSRMWIPARDGVADSRHLGAAFADWTFTDQPPPGATTIE